ncbi:hypothetical protein RDWZM_007980 [Blomia tropicalis]|uniref:Uncharacterized protein n=1 Tax=Blomia tropicalis TaxID=40697 RepID=A0A9Q0M190_BLOTA|nr:hypothetical protein RDWZM_007980 [Blomia tropicalis]
MLHLHQTILGLYGCVISLVFAIDYNVCLINEQLGYSDPANIYQCKPPLKCCTEYSKPSCCGGKPSLQIIKEQVTLWGGLFAILLAIASIVYCRKNDLNIPACSAFKRCLVRFCCGGGDATGSGHNNNMDDDIEKHSIALKINHQSTINVNNHNSVKSARHGWRNNSVNPMTESSNMNATAVV